MYQVLAATSATLQRMLRDALAADAGPGGLAGSFGSPGSVSLERPSEMADANREGLSLWLYRVERDGDRLNDPPRVRTLPSGALEVERTPLPVRLQYLITPITANSPDTEQRLLGLVMQVFHAHPVVAGPFLQAELAGTDAEIHVHLEALGLEEMARVWEAMEGAFRLSVAYEVTMARIEAGTDPLVQVPVESVALASGLMLDREAS